MVQQKNARIQYDTQRVPNTKTNTYLSPTHKSQDSYLFYITNLSFGTIVEVNNNNLKRSIEQNFNDSE